MHTSGTHTYRHTHTHTECVSRQSDSTAKLRILFAYAELRVNVPSKYLTKNYSSLFLALSLFFLTNTVTKFIRIGIADKNDNPPYFDKSLYEAEVDENEDIQHTVLTVTAKDHDECKY